MHVRLLGDPHDVTGFALAGVESQECATRAELIRALDDAGHDPSIAIVMVSPGVAALAADVIQDLRDSARLPIAIVLPRSPDAGPKPGAQVPA